MTEKKKVLFLGASITQGKVSKSQVKLQLSRCPLL